MQKSQSVNPEFLQKHDSQYSHEDCSEEDECELNQSSSSDGQEEEEQHQNVLVDDMFFSCADWEAARETKRKTLEL